MGSQMFNWSRKELDCCALWVTGTSNVYQVCKLPQFTHDRVLGLHSQEAFKIVEKLIVENQKNKNRPKYLFLQSSPTALGSGFLLLWWKCMFYASDQNTTCFLIENITQTSMYKILSMLVFFFPVRKVASIIHLCKS